MLGLVLLAGAGLGGWIFGLNRQVTLLQETLRAAEAERRRFEERVEEERRRSQTDRATLENRIEESRKREEDLRRQITGAARDADAQALSSELRRVRSRLVTLEGERAAGERIIREYGAGVCVIQGSYAFYDAEGRPLRYRVDESGQKVREADGSVAVDVDGNGPRPHRRLRGDGVSRGSAGLRRHQPPRRRALVEERDGGRSREAGIQAALPRPFAPSSPAWATRSRPSSTACRPPSTSRCSRSTSRAARSPPCPSTPAGAARCRASPWSCSAIPTGLEAILAKTDAGVVQDILSSQGTSNERITEALSRRGLIRPSTTQGHIGDVTSTDIVFDAPTTHGGSGGPVFNKDRRVIAVEYAVLPEFTGNSYGIPARYAQELTAR